MITIKSHSEIERMKIAGRVLAKVHKVAENSIRVGMSTYELDKIIHEEILKENCIPSFLGYQGFPASSCISMNDVVVHGIPSKNIIIKEGDIVSVDIGVEYKGYHSDAARTHEVSVVDEKYITLNKITKESFFEGLKFCREGFRISDISKAIENYILKHNYSIVRELTGHGIGTSLHEDPMIPNFVSNSKGPRLKAGMTIAVEPMVNFGSAGVYVHEDGWTISTIDGSMSSHYENTILITESDPEILSLLEEE